ncbi:MAG: endonuclease/exonuclease/phosphatase family protein [Planctomycetes bacterium]|nr:endonuclease/exonuclease/phosphatase family protein [Planctomycetota bacterium]
MGSSAPHHARLAKAFFCSSLLFAGCVVGGIFFQPISIFSNFVCYFLALSLLTYLLTFTKSFASQFWTPSRLRKVALFAIVSQALIPLAQYIPANSADLESQQHFSITWMNLHFEQAAVNELDELMKKSPSDIVVIAEATTHDLKDKFSNYPYTFSVPSADLFLFSKFPFTNQVAANNGDDRAFLVSDIGIARRRFRLITAHVAWPTSPAHYQSLKSLASLAQTFDNVLIAADLNSSAWTSPFREMLDTANLQHARQGYGLLNSWHIDSSKILGLQLDHFLYKGDINNTAFEVIATKHSDHRAIRAEFDLGGKFLRKLSD